ncbi:MAG: chorismate synthase [Cyclobacteriaceae bacterium]|nr:chorismate synthase [Cyclobacteriaceae bacterium]
MSSTLGTIFKITSFGESHGPSVGVVIDGCPAGLVIDSEFIQSELLRRRPGQSKITTARNETEAFEIISGVFEGKSTGAPITIIIANSDARSKDYNHNTNVYRPSHADYTYQKKYGHRDHRGGGRTSARITAGWVAAGAIAKQLLDYKNIKVQAYVSQAGAVKLATPYMALDLANTESNIVRCPDTKVANEMIALIEETKKAGDTIGGVITCVATNMPVGLGEPVFDKLHAALGHAMLSINAVKGVAFGSGFEGAKMKGSEHNDVFVAGDNITTKTNHSGGIQGGISNGEDVVFRVAFKPVATIMKEQPTVDKFGNATTIKGKGRHDPCVVPRAVPIVESMAAIVLADFVLRAQSTTLEE